MQKHYTYLALGDSYTIGEGVLLQQSFPYQTTQLLRKDGYEFVAPEIIAKTGWTTEELQAGVATHTFASKYDFVSLLIGVNNQYRGQDIILYKEQFETLLNKSIELAGGKKDHVFVLSIPDYSRTPFGQTGDAQKISTEIAHYNKLSKAICIQYKVSYVDTGDDLSETGGSAEDLAGDGLHPSASTYAKWSKKLAAAIEKQVKK